SAIWREISLTEAASSSEAEETVEDCWLVCSAAAARLCAVVSMPLAEEDTSCTSAFTPVSNSLARARFCSLRLVRSVANFTTFHGRPFRSMIGLYEASIQTSWPPLPIRLYWAAWYSPRRSFSQNARYSALCFISGSTNRLWCLPLTSFKV